MRNDHAELTIEEVTDPDELAAMLRRFEQFDRNAAWLEAHGDEIFERYRGKTICVSEGEVFAADTSLEAIALAKAAHPTDGGRLIYQIPLEKAARIYAN